MLLENDRVRVRETALAPGERTQSLPHLDSAVYVIDGGRVRIAEESEEGKRREIELVRPSVSGHWLRAARRGIANVGTTPYRQLSVELK